MNEFKFYGTVLKTPKLEMDDDEPFCVLYLGVKRTYNENSPVDNFAIFCYKKIAEDACENLEAGNKIIIKGRMEGYLEEYDHRDLLVLVAQRIEYID